MDLRKSDEIGNVGSYDLEVSDKGIASAKASLGLASDAVKASVVVEVDVVMALEVLAKKSDNQIDDAMVAMVKSALGR